MSQQTKWVLRCSSTWWFKDTPLAKWWLKFAALYIAVLIIYIYITYISDLLNKHWRFLFRNEFAVTYKNFNWKLTIFKTRAVLIVYIFYQKSYAYEVSKCRFFFGLAVSWHNDTRVSARNVHGCNGRKRVRWQLYTGPAAEQVVSTQQQHLIVLSLEQTERESGSWK